MLIVKFTQDCSLELLSPGANPARSDNTASQKCTLAPSQLIPTRERRRIMFPRGRFTNLMLAWHTGAEVPRFLAAVPKSDSSLHDASLSYGAGLGNTMFPLSGSMLGPAAAQKPHEEDHLQSGNHQPGSFKSNRALKEMVYANIHQTSPCREDAMSSRRQH